MPPAESVFLRHEPCPACREHGLDLDGDNLARYSDGHGYCHACGHYEKTGGGEAHASPSRARRMSAEPFTPLDVIIKALKVRGITA